MNTALTKWLGGTMAILALAGAVSAADYWWNGTTNNWNTQNWESPSETPTTGIPAGWDSVYNTKGGKVILTDNRQPGYFRFASGELEIVAGGMLNPAGSGGGSIGTGPATITVNGGTFTGQGPIGPSAGGAVVNLQTGTWTKTGSDNFYARLGGRINQTGGTLAVGTFSLVLGQQDAWSHSNGDFYFGDASGSAGTITGTGNLIVGNITNKMGGSSYQRTTYGTFVGHGTVGLTGTLRNNGYVVADGYGQERTLDLSSFTTVDNTVGNDEYKLVADSAFYYGKGGTGWFAVNGGKLSLPMVTVATGAAAYNWGEAAADADIDLVNSVRLAFADVSTGGSLSIALLAPDRSELERTYGDLVGVWDISAAGLVFTTTDLTFRYDDGLAAALGLVEADLKLYHLVGNAWLDITSGIDTGKKQIFATGVDSFSLFAVGVGLGIIPEPSAGLLLALGGLVALRRRR